MASIYDQYVVLTAVTNDGVKKEVRLLVDPATGALIVTGAGATASATALRIQDGNVAGQFAAVDAQGGLSIVIKDKNSGNKAAVNPDGTLNVKAVTADDAQVTGDITAANGANSFVQVASSFLDNGQGGVAFELRGQSGGAWAAGTVLVLEGTIDGNNWFTLTGYSLGEGMTRTQFPGPGPYQVRMLAGDMTSIRVRAASFNSGDHVLVTFNISAANGAVVVKNPLPQGSNHLGQVGIDNALPAGTNNIGDVDVVTLPELRGRTRFTQVLKLEPSPGEEFRTEEVGSDTYHGLAADGALVSDPVWDVVKLYAGGTRGRLKTGIRWDTKTGAAW